MKGTSINSIKMRGQGENGRKSGVYTEYMSILSLFSTRPSQLQRIYRGALKFTAVCFMILTSLWIGSARADLYAYTDENGILNITNVPSVDSRYKLLRKEDNGRTWKSSINALKPGTRRTHKKTAGLDNIVQQAAQAYKVDAALVHAVIHAESSFNPNAVSPKGASGLMQLMPATARRYGVQDIFDPKQNVGAGVRYLKDLLKMFDNNPRLALAAYNAGENAVIRFGGIPPYPETTQYVSKVLTLHTRYRKTS